MKAPICKFYTLTRKLKGKRDSRNNIYPTALKRQLLSEGMTLLVMIPSMADIYVQLEITMRIIKYQD